MPCETWRMRLARPRPCCGPMVSSVRSTTRSRVPCNTSLDIQEESRPSPLGCQEEPRRRRVLLVAQGVDGIEGGRAQGGVEARQEADADRHRGGEDDGAGGHDGVPARVEGDALRNGDAHADAEEAAGRADGEGLHHELVAYVAAGGA